MPSVVCQICDNNFYSKPSHQKLGWGKYCSVECRSKAQLKGKICICQVCGKQVYKSLAQIKHSKSGKLFCGKSCQTKWRNSYFIEEKHPNWLGGTESYRKILLRANKKRVCICCDIKDSRVLIVHHIDHNRSNNNVENLTWVCMNCHYLIHHDSGFEESFRKLLY